jgi:hypothetical protein
MTDLGVACLSFEAVNNGNKHDFPCLYTVSSIANKGAEQMILKNG